MSARKAYIESCVQNNLNDDVVLFATSSDAWARRRCLMNGKHLGGQKMASANICGVTTRQPRLSADRGIDDISEQSQKLQKRILIGSGGDRGARLSLSLDSTDATARELVNSRRRQAAVSQTFISRNIFQSAALFCVLTCLSVCPVKIIA